MLQRVAACCSVLQFVAACCSVCSVLRSVAACCINSAVFPRHNPCRLLESECCSVLQRVAECVVERRSVIQRAAVYAVYYSVFQRVVACCVTSSLFPTNNLSLVLRPESAAG